MPDGVSHPLSLPGPPQPIDHARGGGLEILPDDVKALVIGRMMDRITSLQSAGGSEATLRVMRTMVQVAINGLCEVELRRAAGLGVPVDFDPTTR